MTGVELTGVDGANPLGFLAAVGTLQVLSDAWPSEPVLLRWQVRNGAWRPVLQARRCGDAAAVVAALHGQLHSQDAAAPFVWERNLNVPRERFRQFAAESSLAAGRINRRTADFAAAFGGDAINPDGTIQDTAFRTMSGAGHQHFLVFMQQLSELTEPGHLERALFEPWTYADPPPSLRWDPVDDRRYALRWNEPSGDPIRTVRGANRLAIEGLRCFPTAVVRGRLETTGFRGTRRHDTFWTWPIWETWLDVSVVRSALALAELRDAPLDRVALARRGITEVFRAQRVTVGKYRNFSPAQSA